MFVLRTHEIPGVEMIPEGDLASLAAELDLIPEEVIDRHALLEQLVPRLLDRARTEGLPFSRYDADDLERLPTIHRTALAAAMGWSGDVTAILKAGDRVYKTYRKARPHSQIPIFLPVLLPALARHAAEVG